MQRPIKIIHTADFHFSHENQDKALQSLETVCNEAEEKEADLIVIAGDLFDRPVNNTESSGFPALIKMIQRMMNIAPVVAVTGTPTHDIIGCYEAFREINANYKFLILDPSKKYFLHNDYSFSNETFEPGGNTKLLIFGIPEPSKQWFLKDQQLGKAEADEAIKKGMRDLLLGMEAIRKQYPDIPCLLVYHGTIAGSTLNNSQVLPAGGIQIGKDDLALAQADYYALGNIHLAQQIGDLPAWYSGSAFPVDWGETDQKGFNFVKIDHEITSIQFIPYPHPPRKKIVANYGDDIEPFGVKDYQVWITVKTKDRSLTDEHRQIILNHVLANGALPGSRVTTEIIPTETIRSETITEASKLRDKVKVYADLSGDSVSDSILDKADTLELTAKEEGLAAEGLHIRIKKLILRGAIGIHKGIGKDQIEIDFDSYDPGLIALIGVNGSGKTTLIENMHPYIQMLTRSGKLQDHFYLRDSFRDLYFVDERTGIEYRAFMQIDGVNKSGSVECFLYRKEDGAFTPASAEINGRQAPYVDYIQDLFGSLQLFLRSAFVSQKQPKNLPDLSDATKGEKKALFRELGGLDYLQIYSDKSKDWWQALDRELIGDRSTIENLEKDVAVMPEKRKELQQLDTKKAETEKRLKEIEKKGFKLKEQLDDLSRKVEKNKEFKTNIDSVSREINGCEEERDDLKKKIIEYQQAMQKKDDFENRLKDLEDLKKQEAELNEEKSKILEKREQLFSQYQHEKDAVADTEKKINAKTAEIQSKLAGSQSDRTYSKTRAEQLEEDLREPITENCPTCGQKWPAEKKAEFEQKRAEKEKFLSEFKQKIFEFDKQIVSFKNQLKQTQIDIEALPWPKTPELPSFDETHLKHIQQQLSLIDESFLRSELEKAKEAEVRIEESEKRIEILGKQIEKANETKAELMHQIDEEAEAAYNETSVEMERTRSEYSETDKVLARIDTEIIAMTQQIQDLAAKQVELMDLQGVALEKKRNLQEWQYLQRACGSDGIQALELDAIGPGIAEVANSILESAYGSRFRIEFKTTRIGGKGSNTRQIEDFLIIIHDSMNGDEQLLETLSGGESIWIKRAIYDAFGIIRARKTGTKFLTVFIDEMDGALDPEARIKYFRMLEKAHQESGRYHTLIISHSSECQEMVAQKILMEQLHERNKTYSR